MQRCLICMEKSSWMTGQIFYVDGGAFDYGHRIPFGIQGAAMNTRRACAGRPEIKGMAPGEIIYEGPPRK